jgi:hypothetical protein
MLIGNKNNGAEQNSSSPSPSLKKECSTFIQSVSQQPNLPKPKLNNLIKLVSKSQTWSSNANREADTSIEVFSPQKIATKSLKMPPSMTVIDIKSIKEKFKSQLGSLNIDKLNDTVSSKKNQVTSKLFNLFNNENWENPNTDRLKIFHMQENSNIQQEIQDKNEPIIDSNLKNVDEDDYIYKMKANFENNTASPCSISSTLSSPSSTCSSLAFNITQLSDECLTNHPNKQEELSQPQQQQQQQQQISIQQQSKFYPTLPYHYSVSDNLYICNLCNCTYDTLRSIKAHLWKHSGHHELSYPISDYNLTTLNSSIPNEPSPNDHFLLFTTADLNSKMSTIIRNASLCNNNICSPQLSSSDMLAKFSNEMKVEKEKSDEDKIDAEVTLTNYRHMSGNRGICSALLEVIEKKLKDEQEESLNAAEVTKADIAIPELDVSDKIPIMSKRKLSAYLRNGSQANTYNYSTRLSSRKKFKIKDHLNMNRSEIKSANADFDCDAVECNIETTIVNSLFDDNVSIMSAPVVVNSKKRITTYNGNHSIARFGLADEYNREQESDGSTNLSSSSGSSVNNMSLTRAIKAANSKHLQDDDKRHRRTPSPLSLFTSVVFLSDQETKLYAEKKMEKRADKSSLHNLKRDTLRELLKCLLKDDLNDLDIIDNDNTLKADFAAAFANDINRFNNEKLKKVNMKLFNFLTILATNDGYEQYVCKLCSYACYHLPSLKSHMWSHVKSEKFDYSINTAIINAALDYESKLSRRLNTIRESMSVDESDYSHVKSTKGDEEDRFFLNSCIQRQLLEALDVLELIDKAHHVMPSSTNCKKPKSSKRSYDQNKNGENSESMPMVHFRCSKCGYDTIDLCLLRLHKYEHLTSVLF